MWTESPFFESQSTNFNEKMILKNLSRLFVFVALTSAKRLTDETDAVFGTQIPPNLFPMAFAGNLFLSYCIFLKLLDVTFIFPNQNCNYRFSK